MTDRRTKDTVIPAMAVGGAEHRVGHLLYARMWQRFLHELGLVRDAAGLSTAAARFEELLATLPGSASEVRNLALVGSLIAAAALRREESRGAHFRSDYPDVATPQRTFVTWNGIAGAPDAAAAS